MSSHQQPRYPPKLSKVQLSLQSDQRDLIVRAAQIQQTTLTNFIVENALVAAQQVLADQVHFELPPGRWEAFCSALDAPPKEIPALRELLTANKKLLATEPG